MIMYRQFDLVDGTSRQMVFGPLGREDVVRSVRVFYTGTSLTDLGFGVCMSDTREPARSLTSFEASSGHLFHRGGSSNPHHMLVDDYGGVTGLLSIEFGLGVRVADRPYLVMSVTNDAGDDVRGFCGFELERGMRDRPGIEKISRVPRDTNFPQSAEPLEVLESRRGYGL